MLCAMSQIINLNVSRSLLYQAMKNVNNKGLNLVANTVLSRFLRVLHDRILVINLGECNYQS